MSAVERFSRELMEKALADTEVTEMICKLMEEQNVSRRELASRMGIKRRNLDWFLDEWRGTTINGLASMLFHLGYRIKRVELERIDDD